MKRVSKKNISLYVRDVRPPQGASMRPAPPAPPIRFVSERDGTSVHIRKQAINEEKGVDAIFSHSSRLRSKSRSKGERITFVTNLTTRDVKNISRQKLEAHKFLTKKNAERSRFILPQKLTSKLRMGVTLALLSLVIFSSIVYGMGILKLRHDGKDAIKNIYANLKNSVDNFKNFNPGAAKASLLSADASLSRITQKANS